MIKLKNLLLESVDIQKYVGPQIQHSHTIEDFLKSLVGKKLHDLLDATSFGRLYLGNKYGFNDQEAGDPMVLVTKLLEAATTFINWRKLRPLRKQLDDKEAEHRGTPQAIEFEKKKRELFKAKYTARDSGNKDVLAQLQKQYDDHMDSDPSQYRKNMNDFDALVKQFHNTPLTLPDVMPSPHDTPEDKQAFERAKEAFEAAKSIFK